MPDDKIDKCDQLAAKLYDSDSAIGAAAAEELLELGPEGCQVLVTELTDIAKSTRSRISELVRKKFTFERLKKMANSSAYEEEYAGVHLLGISQFQGAFEVLMDSLMKKLSPHAPAVGEVRVWYVIDGLGLLGDKRGLLKLQELEKEGMTKYKDIDIQKAAKTAIRNIELDSKTK